MKKNTDNDLEQEFSRIYSAHREGKFSKAEKGYLKLLDQKPDWGEVLSALGNLFLDQAKPEKAIPVFEKAASLNPPDLSACYNLGRLKQLENDHQAAIPLYKRILDHQPDIGLVWNNLGVAYRETGKAEEAFSSFKQAVKLAPQMAQAWNNLGVAQDEHQMAKRALTSYEKAIEIEPKYTSPRLNYGIGLQKLERFKEAEEQYKKVLELQPENEVAQFMLHSIGGIETPDAAPVNHVRSIFDQCAENFDSLLVDGLEYKTPELLFNLVRPYLNQNLNILDIGCGTGLGAQLYQPFSKTLTGVDVSSKMLEKASQKKIYDRLEVFDILQTWEFPAKFDLIYSSDVFVYFGSIDKIIDSASSYLTMEGLIAFSVEKLEGSSKSYKLYPSGRYAHTEQYIRECMERHGFHLLELSTADVRNQSGQPVKGLLVVGQKK